MKKIHIFALLGLPLVLISGLFWYAHLLYVGFEHRENHNGVSYNSFSQSLRNHVEGGPNVMSDFSHYEGKWWFDITDEKLNFYSLWIGRENYSNASDMDALKSVELGLLRIGSKNLVCENSLGEKIKPFAKRKRLGDEAFSINQMIKETAPLVSSFGESLPQTYSIRKGKVVDFPKGLLVDANRNSNCCSQTLVMMEPATSVSCRLG